MNLRTQALAGLLAFGLGSGALQAQTPDGPAGGWYVGAGARAVKVDSWDAGYGPSALIGWKLPYRHSATPRSSVAFEAEFAGTTHALSRRRAGSQARARVDLQQGGAFLALNTYMGERVFHRVRLGGVVRELAGERRDRVQARLAFGLGLGVRLVSRLELVADLQTQFLGDPDALLHEAGVTARWHF